jgi:AcrR family transcriptional regulator
VTTKSQRPRVMDRLATERALEGAAVALLERDGVLAGLNLQKVADAAGVNRGLVYHYFGSRRDLLRKALRTTVSGMLDGVETFWQLPIRQRTHEFFQAMVRHNRIPRLMLLLAIDGDRAFRMVVDDKLAAAAFIRDVADGELTADVDIEALEVAVTSLVFAYAVRRVSFARELGVPVRELDRRVEATLDRMLAGLHDPDAPTRPDGATT